MLASTKDRHRNAVETEQPHTEPDHLPLRLRAEMAQYLDEEPQVNFHKLDVRFHRAISDLGGNPELAIAVMRVHQRIQSVCVRCQVPGRLRIAHRQHGRISTAIRKGEAAAAEEAITEHVTSACEHILDITRRAAL